MALKRIIFLKCEYRCESVSVCAAMTYCYAHMWWFVWQWSRM